MSKLKNVFPYTDLVKFVEQESNYTWNESCHLTDVFRPVHEQRYVKTDIDELISNLANEEISIELYNYIKKFMDKFKITNITFV
ncbi:MAG TPA: hypothetical protein PKD00_03230 [Burkholderiales bacterium]|nr:hypothetical protein [Burkholderiales bacterium]